MAILKHQICGNKYKKSVVVPLKSCYSQLCSLSRDTLKFTCHVPLITNYFQFRYLTTKVCINITNYERRNKISNETTVF